MAEINLTEVTDENLGVPAAGAETARVVTVSPADAVEALGRVEAFADLPEEQLRWFVENSNERNRVESKPGDTCFQIRLPLAENNLPNNGAGEVKISNKRSPERFRRLMPEFNLSSRARAAF